MELHELNGINEVQFEGNWIPISEIYVENDNYLKVEATNGDIFFIPISSYHAQAGTIGEIYWDEIEKDSEVLKAYMV